MNEAYLRTVARNLGCPEMWLDDCVQEMRIAMWLKGEYKNVVRNAGIDFLRMHGEVSRAGVVRVVPRGENVRDFSEWLVPVMDAEAALKKLSPETAESLRRQALGIPAKGSAEFQRRFYGRTRLRKLVA